MSYFKLILLFLFIGFFLRPVSAQSDLGFEVVRELNSEDNIIITNYKIDFQGNHIYAGIFNNDITINGSTHEDDFIWSFIMKEDADHNLVFFGDFDSNFMINEFSFDIDPDGNIYMAGTYNGDSLVYNGTIYKAVQDHATGTFLFKLSPDGEVLWHQLIETGHRYGQVSIRGPIRWDPEGVYVGITQSNHVVFSKNGIYYDQFSDTNSHYRMIKFSHGGDILNYSTHTNPFMNVSQVKIPGNGKIYISGDISGVNVNSPEPLANFVVDFSGTYIHNRHLYIMEMDQNTLQPTWLWYGLNLASSEMGLHTYIDDIDFGPNGEIYAIANFSTKVDLRNGTVVQASGTAQSSFDYFDKYILRFSNSGKLTGYVQVPSHTTSKGYGIVVNNGEITVADAGGKNNTFHTYDLNFNAVYNTVVEGSFYPEELTLQNDGNIYAAGGFNYYYKNGEYFPGNTYAGYVARFIGCEVLPENFVTLTGPIHFCMENSLQTFEAQTFENKRYKYVWTVPEGFRSPGEVITDTNFIELEVLHEGLYEISVKLINECDIRSNTLNLEVIVDEALTDLFIRSNNCNDRIYSENLDSAYIYQNGVEIGKYLLDNFQVSAAGNYKLRVSNSCGQFESNEIYLDPMNESIMEIPNVITPNDDGLNDVWDLSELKNVSNLKIFNRWGKLVFKEREYMNNWNGKGLSSGVYYYYIESECVSSPLRGQITVLN